MENNFKGTKISNEDDLSISHLINEYNIHLNGDCIGQAFNEEDGNTFYDGLLVRQQIDCSLPELLERYKKMEEALRSLFAEHAHLVEMVQNQAPKILRDLEHDYQTLSEANEALNLNK